MTLRAAGPGDAAAMARVLVQTWPGRYRGLVDSDVLDALDEDFAPTSHGDAIERRMVQTGEPYLVPVDPGTFTGWREHALHGEVNDGNAHHAFAGVAGHAGLFSTARDLVAFGEALLDGGGMWSQTTVERFTREPFDPGQGLGFWTRRLR